MKGEFYRIVTRDRVELQGLLVASESGPSDSSVIHIHGLAGNFYENRFIDHVADAAVSRGFDFVTINNRGHDYISDFIRENADGSMGYEQIGGIYEVFADCISDIEAWVEFVAGLGASRIILEGHSHGALKAAYYLNRVADQRIRGLILLSPSDDFGCQREQLGDRFDEALDVARRLVGEGRGRDLMPREFFHYPVSAATYLDIFQEESSLKMFNLSGTDTEAYPELESIRVPVLAIVGTVEEAFVGEPEQYLASMEASLRNTPDFSGHVISGATHNYLGHEARVAAVIKAWLGRWE